MRKPQSQPPQPLFDVYDQKPDFLHSPPHKLSNKPPHLKATS